MAYTRRMETRARVLQAALSIAAQEGFAAATPLRVGSRSQLTAWGVVTSFGSVAAFREEIVQIGIIIWEQLIPPIGRTGTGLRGLWFDWASWFCRARHLPTFLDLLPGYVDADRLHPDGPLREAVMQFWKRREQKVAEYVAEAAEAGELKGRVDAAEFHAFLMGAALRLPMRSRWLGNTEQALAEAIWTCWRRIGQELKTPLAEDDVDAAFLVPGADAPLGDLPLRKEVRYAEAIRRTGTIRSLPDFCDPMM